jgi:salicylate hydroxylase
VHLLPGRHVVAYPLRDRGVLNLVAVEERDEWTAEGWSHPGDAAQAISRFEDLAQNMRNVLQSIETVHVWGLFKRDVPAIWHSGMAGIIGDAVHPTLPFLAQGANLGLEDALCLAHAMDRAEDVTEGWQAFTRMRLDRVRRVVGAADRNATLYHLSGPAAMAAHLGLRAGSALAPKAPLRSFDWLYRWTPPAL